MQNRIISYFTDPLNSEIEIGVELDFTRANFEFVDDTNPEISLENYLSDLEDERISYTLNPNPKKKPPLH